jgi:hypothetical protein
MYDFISTLICFTFLSKFLCFLFFYVFMLVDVLLKKTGERV